jgi:hypothetical protein
MKDRLVVGRSSDGTEIGLIAQYELVIADIGDRQPHARRELPRLRLMRDDCD